VRSSSNQSPFTDQQEENLDQNSVFDEQIRWSAAGQPRMG